MTLARLLDKIKITDFDHIERERIVDFFMEQDGYAAFLEIFED